MEPTDRFVVTCHLTFTLQYVNLHGGLVISRSREDLALSGRDRRVSIDQPGEYATERFDTQRQRGNIQQQDVFHLTGQHTTLNCSTDSDHLIGVHSFRRGLTEELFNDFLDSRDTGRTTDQNHLIDLTGRQTCIGNGLLTRLNRSPDQAVGQLFEFGPRQRHDQVLWNTIHRHDVGQVDLGRGRARKFDFGLFGGLFQPLQCHRVFSQIDIVLFLELIGHPVDDHMVEVITTEVGITVGRFYLEDTVAQLQDGDIERTTTQVIHGDLHILVCLIQTVSQSSGRRFVDDTADFQASDFTGLFGGLTL